MPTYTTEFSTSTPTTINRGSELPEYLCNGKASLDERYSLEHESLAANSGDTIESQARHIPGKVSCVQISSTAPTESTAGSLWYDTALNQLKIYSGSSWSYVMEKRTQLSVQNCLSLCQNTNTIVSGATVVWINIPINLGGSTTTVYFTPTIAGIYLISCQFFVEQNFFEYKPSNIPKGDPFNPIPLPVVTTITMQPGSYPLCKFSLNHQQDVIDYYSATYRKFYTIPAGCRKFGIGRGCIVRPLTTANQCSLTIKNQRVSPTQNISLKACAGSGTCWLNFSLLRTL